MKLFPELSDNDIKNDLKHYYTNSELNHLDNSKKLRRFFNDHVKKYSKDVEIQDIFNTNDKILVDTPDGFQSIGEKIEKRERKCFKIVTSSGKSISCSYDHLLETPEGWKYANDVTKKDLILTIDGFEKIKYKYQIKDQKVYDFEVSHKNHRYWGGNGISSHNTGKTYLSLIEALHLMKKYEKYQRLILVKSVQTIQGESIGYLPGTIWEKMEPYMYSFTGNLDKIFSSKKTTKKLIEDEVIEIMPIAYTRGITFDNVITIIDEAQNIDMHTFKTIITRIGNQSKMIFLGDIEQIDRKNKKESCLEKVRDLFKNREHTDSLHFTSKESIRNPIIPDILKILNGNE